MRIHDSRLHMTLRAEALQKPVGEVGGVINLSEFQAEGRRSRVPDLVGPSELFSVSARNPKGGRDQRESTPPSARIH